MYGSSRGKKEYREVLEAGAGCSCLCHEEPSAHADRLLLGATKTVRMHSIVLMHVCVG